MVEPTPLETDFNLYNPKAIGTPRAPCFVRIHDEAKDRFEKKKYKEPSLQFAQTARFTELVPRP
jgi:hypothetical protein